MAYYRPPSQSVGGGLQLGAELEERRGKIVCDQFNGWTNRETWATKLHLDNDEILNEWAWEYARNWEEAGEELSVYELGETLKNWIEDDLLTLENIAGNRGLYLMLTDIGSLYRVDWQEIAQSYLDEIATELANAL